MATYDSIEKASIHFPLTCDDCGSNNIQETIQGYVCRECGLVLKINRHQYFRPYNEDIVQYARLSTTQIGTRLERQHSPFSRKLRSLNRLQKLKDHKKRVFDKARVEIKRILSALDIPHSFHEAIFLQFKQIYSKFNPSTKYRSVEKLVPIILYYSLRDQNITIDICKLLEVSKISKSEFNLFRLQVGQNISSRGSVKRQRYISQMLIALKEQFHLGMEFVFYAKKVMVRLWELIKSTTDNVIAGVSASITILCYYKDQICIKAICKLLGIRMSTIQF
jgi:transcription initiation factor TFIIIB Brf1 subunit/transcription initiation factor TFIIB